MNKAYTLTKSNKILLFIGSAFLVGAKLISPEAAQVFSGSNSEMMPTLIGEIVGTVLGALFFPAIISWVVWRVRGRKENAGSYTFNIVFIFVVLGFILATLGRIQGRVDSMNDLTEMQLAAQEHKAQLALAETPEQAKDLQERYARTVDDKFEALKNKDVSDDEKIFYSIAQSVTKEAASKESEWQSAFARTQEDDVLDISVLDDENAYQNQVTILNFYKEKSKSHAAYSQQFLPTMTSRIHSSDISASAAKNYIAGMEEANAEKQKLVQPLFLQHQKYADGMLAYLNFLHKNKASWEFVDGNVSFNKADLTAEYEIIVSELLESETKLNQMMQGS